MTNHRWWISPPAPSALGRGSLEIGDVFTEWLPRGTELELWAAITGLMAWFDDWLFNGSLYIPHFPLWHPPKCMPWKQTTQCINAEGAGVGAGRSL